LKVLMVTSSYPKYPGDVTAPFIESIARGVVARGHAVDILLPEHPELARPAGEPMRFFPYRYAPSASLALWGYAQSLQSDVKVRRSVYLVAPLAAWSLRRALRRRLRAERYDVVHAHWVVPNAALVSDLVGRGGEALVVSCHGSDVFMAERLRPARHLARRALRKAGAVTACSDDLRTRLVTLGAPPARLRTVPYGVDAAGFGGARPDPELRGRLGVKEGEILVLAVGRLVEKKGFRHLVQAAAGTPGVVLAIAGEGDLRGELEEQGRASGARLHLLGSLQRDAVAAAMGSADVIAVPSVIDRAGNVDGLPNVLLEALGAGRAVVASRVAGIPDVISDGVHGLLVEPGQAGALGAALVRLRDDAALRARLGDAARRKAQSELSWDAAAHAFEECYVQATSLPAR
jgi:glycosyltransferase involved in cell wall biosynthesis